MDSAISRAGGDDLPCDQQALPVIHPNPNSAKAVRCMMGNAAITGSNSYGQLRMPFFIHAVSPNYSRGEYKYSEETGDIKLKETYSASMACAKEKGWNPSHSSCSLLGYFGVIEQFTRC